MLQFTGTEANYLKIGLLMNGKKRFFQSRSSVKADFHLSRNDLAMR